MLKPYSPYLGYILVSVGIAGMILTLLRVIFRKIKVNDENNFTELNKRKVTPEKFEEINIKQLSSWCKGWGNQYNHLNRIVLYAHPPQSELRYELYFEFDVFSKEGEKQSEAFNQGHWDHQHFPVHNDIEKFKNVYNEKPKDSTYINEWDFFSNARDSDKEIPEGVPSIEIYKKKKPNP